MGKMKECTLLDNSLFDDGTIECKNFQVSSIDDYYICEWTDIQNTFSGKIQRQIIEAIAQGKQYVAIEHKMICEISWD